MRIHISQKILKQFCRVQHVSLGEMKNQITLVWELSLEFKESYLKPKLFFHLSWCLVSLECDIEAYFTQRNLRTFLNNSIVLTWLSWFCFTRLLPLKSRDTSCVRAGCLVADLAHEQGSEAEFWGHIFEDQEIAVLLLDQAFVRYDCDRLVVGNSQDSSEIMGI